MPEGIDQAADAFRNALGGTEKLPARDERGRFEQTSKPEPLFQERRTEGDEFGDTSDGGEDARRRRQEERANGEPFENQLRRSNDEGRQPRSKSVRTPGNEGDDEPTKTEQAGAGDEGERGDDSDLEGGHEAEDAEGREPDGEPEQDAEGEGSGEKYEVIVDGKPQEVTLKQALDGYVRTETFHQRMAKVNEASQTVALEAQKVAQLRDNYINQLAALEQEINTLLPQQPDWDAEFTRDPKAANELRKQYEAVGSKLQGLRNARAAAFQEQQAEQARNTETYAKNEFARFVMDNKIPDEASLRKEINSMRRTAMSAGFTEQEVATVYDSRMLSILRKASKYDRLMAAKPKAVVPGKGKTLTPGSAPRIGNAARRSIDEAQSRLAKSGRIDDAATVFERLLR